MPYKGDQDKDSLKPGSSEYSKSGSGGDDGAASSNAAFDPSQTSPEQQKRNVGKENGGDVSISQFISLLVEKNGQMLTDMSHIVK
jgi:hypothetical protein